MHFKTPAFMACNFVPFERTRGFGFGPLVLLHGDDLARGQHVDLALGAKVDQHPLRRIVAV